MTRRGTGEASLLSLSALVSAVLLMLSSQLTACSPTDTQSVETSLADSVEINSATIDPAVTNPAAAGPAVTDSDVNDAAVTDITVIELAVTEPVVTKSAVKTVSSAKSAAGVSSPLQAVQLAVEQSLDMPVQIQVDEQRTNDEWVYLTGTPLTAQGETIDYTRTPYAEAWREGYFEDWLCAIVKKDKRDQWHLIALDIGSTDVPFGIFLLSNKKAC